MGYSIFYEIHDAEKMQEKWDEVIPYIQESFKYLTPFAKSTEAKLPIADDGIIDIADHSDMDQPLYFEKEKLIEENTWIKTRLAPYTVAVETVLLIMTKVFGEDIFSLDGGDWEDIDIWYHAALICKRVGLDIDLHEVDYVDEEGPDTYSLGELIENCNLEIEEENISDFDENLIYGHCLLRPEREYPFGYVMSNVNIMMGINIPGKTDLEFEENLEKYNLKIVVKWNVEINEEKMHWYIISSDMTESEWMNFAMQMLVLRNSSL